MQFKVKGPHLVSPPHVKSYGQTITGSPDVNGELRRAKQTLAGTPSAIKVKNPRSLSIPKLSIKGL